MIQIENKNIPKIEAKFEKDEKGIEQIVGFSIGSFKVNFCDREKSFTKNALEELDKAANTILGLPDISSAISFILDRIFSSP